MPETDILAEEFIIANFNMSVQRNYSEVSIMEFCSQYLVCSLQRARSVG